MPQVYGIVNKAFLGRKCFFLIFDYLPEELKHEDFEDYNTFIYCFKISMVWFHTACVVVGVVAVHWIVQCASCGCIFVMQ